MGAGGPSGLPHQELAVPLIYLDLARSFGGALDDADTRLAHYNTILQLAMANGRTARRSRRTRDRFVASAPDERRQQRDRLSSLAGPREHGSVLIEPPLGEVPQLVAANIARHHAARYDVQGRSLQASGRIRSAQAGRAWRTATPRRIATSITCRGRPNDFWLVISPSCFIPACGSRTSRSISSPEKQQATAMNLVIDSDTIKHVFATRAGRFARCPDRGIDRLRQLGRRNSF